MQRLFSTFPGSWPGVGLLILRITVGSAPFGVILSVLAGMDAVAASVAALMFALLALCVVAGFATPIAAPLYAVAALVASRGAGWTVLLATAGGAVSLMMIGPGAWSIDAWLYGRKRIEIGKDRPGRRGSD